MIHEPDAVRMYRAALPPGKLVQLPLAAIDRLDVPFWMLTFYPDHGPTNAGSGYGVTDDDALIGAFGELTEVVSANRAVGRMARVRGSYRELVEQRGVDGIVDPLMLCLEAGSDYSPDRPLQWVATRRWGTDESVLVPLEFVACQNSDVPDDDPKHWLITLITNGLGAGPSLEHAVAHGVLELLQRDGNSVHFRALADPVDVALDEIADPRTRALLDHLDAQGVDVIVKLASTDFGMTNVYVVGADREQTDRTIPVMAAACGEAVHPDREVALQKAVLEFAAARSRLAFSHGPLAPVAVVTPPEYLEQYIARYSTAGEEPRALETMLRWYPRSLDEMRSLLAERVFAVDSTVPFASLPTVDDPSITADKAALLDLIVRRLQAAGFDILVADYSEQGSGVYAVKVIVPGLEVETMSYHRIGERNLRRLLDRGSPLVGIGDPPAGAQPVLLTAAAQARLGGPAWFDVVAAQRVVGDLYCLYREPGRHAAALIHEGRVAYTPRTL